MTYLIPVFVVLTAGWILLAWSLAEHHNLKWLRILCARLFVGIVFCVGVGVGVVGTRYQLRSAHRQQVRELTTGIRNVVATESADEVMHLLNSVVEPPDEWSNASSDILERATTAIERMQSQPDDAQTQELAQDSGVAPISPIRR